MHIFYITLQYINVYMYIPEAKPHNTTLLLLHKMHFDIC